ncbi:MAG: DUF934 domain-containing protein [Burkholderiales bacterium]|jgi:uncharacterized protein (DUF934 family)|nr:DUF934 domain-containing protein [Burkholderiales bacterium]
MKFINATTCCWKHAIGEDGPKPDPDPAPNRLLTLEQWHAVKVRWPQDLPVAIEFPNDADISQLVPDLGRISLVVLDFPKWTDGRAYSQAHLLRTRYKFAGAIRARGEVLVDMMQLLVRTGFDEVVMRGDQSKAAAEKALAFFDDGFYQGDVAETRPWFLRRSAA